MTFSKLWSGVVISLFSVVLFATPASAFADTYKIINLGNANGNGIYGIDASGDVVIHSNNGCGGHGGCFKTYDYGVLDSTSFTAPAMDYDDGTSCKPTALATNGACNDGREAYGAFLGSSFGLFTEGSGNAIFGGSVDQIVMNSVGDIAWTDGMNECNYEAIDLTSSPVPEPNTWLLLATGALGGVGILRRRFVQSRAKGL